MSYYGTSSSSATTLAAIGNNPGGKSGCDGCKRPLLLYGSNFKDGYSLGRIIIATISLVITLIALAGVKYFKQWAYAATTRSNKHGIKTVLAALISLTISYILVIADDALTETGALTTRAYYIIYVFLYAFYLGGAVLLLVTVGRFITTQGAAGPVNAGKHYTSVAVYSTVAAMAVASIAAFIAAIVWSINIVPYDYYSGYNIDDADAVALEDHISYLYWVQNIVDVVLWAVYLLATGWIITKFAQAFTAFRTASRLFIALAVFALFSQAALSLAGDALAIWAYSSISYLSGDQVNLYAYIVAAAMVENFLLAFAGICVVLAAFVARHDLPASEKSHPTAIVRHSEAMAHVR